MPGQQGGLAALFRLLGGANKSAEALGNNPDGGGLGGAAQNLLAQLLQRDQILEQVNKGNAPQGLAPQPPAIPPVSNPMQRPPAGVPQGMPGSPQTPPGIPQGGQGMPGQGLPGSPVSQPTQNMFKQNASIPSAPTPQEAAEKRLLEEYGGKPDPVVAGDAITESEMERVEQDLTPSEKEAYINTLIQEINSIQNGPDTPERQQRIDELMIEVERLRNE